MLTPYATVRHQNRPPPPPFCQNANGGNVKDGKEGRARDQELDAYEYSSRVLAHRPLKDYSLWHCLGYVFYAPLYLAGPTLTFNAYVSQVWARDDDETRACIASCRFGFSWVAFFLLSYVLKY